MKILGGASFAQLALVTRSTVLMGATVTRSTGLMGAIVTRSTGLMGAIVTRSTVWMGATVTRSLVIASALGLAFIGTAVALFPGVSLAQTADGAPKVQVLSGAGSSLSQLAQATRSLRFEHASLVTVELPTFEGASEDIPNEARRALFETLNKNVASLVPQAKERVAIPTREGEARRLARQRDLALTHLTPHVSGGRLRVTVSHRTFAPSFWRRAIHPEGLQASTSVFEVPIDAQVRSVFPPAKALLTQLKKARSPIAAPIALACGSTAKHGEEVLVVGRQELALGTLQENDFRVRVRRSWQDLSPISATPLRAPLAHALIDERGIVVGSSDRALTLALDDGLNVTGRAARAYPLTRAQCLDFTGTGLTNVPRPCPPLGSTPGAIAGPSPIKGSKNETTGGGTLGLDGAAILSFTLATGATTELSATLRHGDPILRIQATSTLSGTREMALLSVGSAFVLGDVDGDGSPDVAASKASPPDSDGIVVSSLGADEPKTIARTTLPSVHALALCPFGGSNPRALVVASEDHLVVYR